MKRSKNILYFNFSSRRLKRNGVILSTDDYFMGNGKYEFDPTQLGQAHEWTQSKGMEYGILYLCLTKSRDHAGGGVGRAQPPLPPPLMQGEGLGGL